MEDIRKIIQAISKGVVGYFKATLKIAGLNFIILAVGLMIIGVDFWFLKALGIAIVDTLPVLGSGIVMLPWAVIHFLIGNTTLAWQIGLLYIVILVFRQIAEPIITGKSIGVRPLYTFISTIICMIIFGPLGAILGAVIAIVIKSVIDVKMIRKQVEE